MLLDWGDRRKAVCAVRGGGVARGGGVTSLLVDAVWGRAGRAKRGCVALHAQTPHA